jgi:hypothetical protein
MRCPRCGCNDCCGAVYDQELVAVTADKDRLLSALRELYDQELVAVTADKDRLLRTLRELTESIGSS